MYSFKSIHRLVYEELKISNLWSHKTNCISQTQGYPSFCKFIFQSLSSLTDFAQTVLKY